MLRIKPENKKKKINMSRIVKESNWKTFTEVKQTTKRRKKNNNKILNRLNKKKRTKYKNKRKIKTNGRR